MLSVSEAMLDYLNSTIRLEGQYIRIEVTTKSGISYKFTDDDLVSGSLKLERKSVSGSTFDIGEAYINYLSFTILDKDGKYSGSFDNAKVLLYFGVVNESLSLDEELLLGTFIIPVDTTVRKVSSIQFTCDSYLSKFDSYLTETTSGKLYSLVTWACTKCDVNFAMTEDAFNSLSANTAFTYFITDDSSLSTYRDVIMYISQLIGGFATDTVDGSLIFMSYKNTADTCKINNDTISSSSLGESSFKLDSIVYKVEGSEVTIGGSSIGYVLELDSNPLLDSLTEDLILTILNNLWLQLSELSFQSFNFSYNGNPVFECGDILVNDARSVQSFVTSVSWSYHGKSTIGGSVLDKRVKTQSQSSKSGKSSGGSSSAAKLNIIRYVNSESYTLGSVQTKVAQTYFTLDSGVSPYISFCMILKSTLVGLLNFTIIYDNLEMDLKPKYTINSGYTTIQFSRAFDPSDESFTHSLSINVSLTDIENLEIDSSDSCVVGAFDIELDILATNIVSSTPKWSGRYEVTDTFNSLVLTPEISLGAFTESTTKSFS